LSSIAIVTDSTSDIPEDLVKKFNIHVIPLTVHFGQQQYLDDKKSLTLDQFYKKLKESDVFPTTSQPSPGDFINLYKKLLKSHDSMISIHISSKLSATMNSALLAKKSLSQEDITIIDSLAAHAPLGLMVLKAAQLNSQGAAKEEILKEVGKMIKSVKAFILPKTLENLKRGGRIGKAKSLLASLLDIKPILTLTEAGYIGIFKTTRHWENAKRLAVKSMGEHIKGKGTLVVVLSDANAKKDVDELQAEIKKMYHPQKIDRQKIGVVVGTHVGTGVGITFYEQ